MATGGVPANPTAHNIAQLLPKLYDEDPDLRYMALNDLNALLVLPNPGLISHDFNVSAKTVDGLIHALKDKNGEVQNMAIKCLGPFVNKIGDGILCPMIDRISNLETGDSVDDSIPSLALRSIVVNLPRPIPGAGRSKAVQDSYSAMSTALIPRLVGHTVIPSSQKGLSKPPKGMLKVDIDKGTDSNAMDVLTEIARCFGPMLQESEIRELSKVSLQVLEHDRTASVLKKKAVAAVAALAPYFTDQLLSHFVSQITEFLHGPHLTKSKRKLYFSLLGSLARAVPKRFGPYLTTLAPFVIAALSQKEIEDDLAALEETEERDPESDEVREAALVALEHFLQACPDDTRRYTKDVIECIVRFIKYDPNVIEDDDEDMEDDEEPAGFDDEDFEEEAGADDDDDTSWKVRRCTAKVAQVLISTRSNGDLLQDGTLYNSIAPTLVSRFKEREESVRIELLEAMALLVRITGGRASRVTNDDFAVPGIMMPPPSRKRRRGGSDASMYDIQDRVSLSRSYSNLEAINAPSSSAMSSLAKMSPDIIHGLENLLKSSPLPTKQASISLLKDLAVSLRGQNVDYLGQTVEPIIEAVKSVSSGGQLGASSVAITNAFKIEALQFLGAVAQSHSADDLVHYLARIIPTIVTAIREKYTKVSVAALRAAEEYVKVLTPPRQSTPTPSQQQFLAPINTAITNRIEANDADLDVRRLAIHVEGLLLGLTADTSLLSAKERRAGYDMLQNRLKNELTRLAVVRAIETTVALTRNAGEFPPNWVPTVALELAAQFRKASRVLRGSSLAALKSIVLNPASCSHLDPKTTAELVPMMYHIFTSSDLHMIGPALRIFADLVRRDAKQVVNKDFINAFCQLLYAQLSGSSLDALLMLVRAIGEQGVGKDLMSMILKDVSMKGNPDVVGKVVGNLLVSGGNTIPVKLNDFVGEASGQKDEKRKCLALSVMGEAGLQLGTSFQLTPQHFTKHFSDPSDKVRLAAAVALGRAGSGNVPVYLPFILDSISKPKAPTYLLLHSIREVLQSEGAESEIIPYGGPLWQNLFTASEAEDNRAIGAACIGRLLAIDPKTYMPQLQVRGTVSKCSLIQQILILHRLS